MVFALSRQPSESTGSVELRVEADPDLVAIVDAVVHARKRRAPGTSRKEVIDEILREWAQNTIHEANIVLRLAKGNGIATE